MDGHRAGMLCIFVEGVNENSTFFSCGYTKLCLCIGKKKKLRSGYKVHYKSYDSKIYHVNTEYFSYSKKLKCPKYQQWANEN